MQLTARATVLLLATLGSLAAVVIACDKPFSVSDAPPIGGGSAGRGPSSAPPSEGKPPPPDGTFFNCPGVRPAVGTPCAGEGRCSYGHDLDSECNDNAVCVRGSFDFDDPRDDCFDRCPTSFGSITEGATCTDPEMGCTYIEGTCGCMADDAGADAGGQWKCVPPPEFQGCPLARPPIGSACVKPMICDYGSCELSRSLAVQCDDFSWAETTKNCE